MVNKEAPIEKLVKDGGDPDMQVQKVSGAMAQNQSAMGKPGAMAADDLFPTAISAFGGRLLGTVAHAAEIVGGFGGGAKDTLFKNNPKEQQKRILNGTPAEKPKPAGKPVVPQSYTEQLATLKRVAKTSARVIKDTELVAKSTLSGMCLGGGSFASNKLSPITGKLKGLQNAAVALNHHLVQELGVALRAKAEPYEQGFNRLRKDLEKGVSGAKAIAARLPSLNNGPKMSGQTQV